MISPRRRSIWAKRRKSIRTIPLSSSNLGVAYQNLGEMDKARAAYEQAVKTGQGVRPTRVTDPRYSGRTVAELARDDLASLPPPLMGAATAPAATPSGRRSS